MRHRMSIGVGVVAALVVLVALVAVARRTDEKGPAVGAGRRILR